MMQIPDQAKDPSKAEKKQSFAPAKKATIAFSELV
jgi:hypothetical protein